MAGKQNVKPRSYTLRLSPPKDCISHEDLWHRLFKTHVASCEGARVFGELFLNLRGCLSPDLADNILKESNKQKAVRGRRRILALGWLSVEDDKGAGNHQHRIKDINKGERLSEYRAKQLLTDILISKGVRDENRLAEWWLDCQGALTANVREGSVWVNRAAVFQGKQPAPTPEEAWIILTRIFGKDLLDLDLAEGIEENKESVEKEEETEPSEKETKISEGAKDPSNKGRQIFCDLFGTGSKGEFDKTARCAERVLSWIHSLKDDDITKESIKKGLKIVVDIPPFPVDELNKRKPKKTNLFPSEVTSGKRPSKFAVRLRKLLVHLDIWRPLDGEDGSPDKKFSILLRDLKKACEEEIGKGKRVLRPEWSKPVYGLLAERTGICFNAEAENGISPTEFGYLFAGLGARRVSQTHSWIKLNEKERHKASLKADAAKEKLKELDPLGQARIWLKAYEDRRKEETGALDEYRITPRAISGFEDVLNKWKSASTPIEREKGVEEAQSGSEKFGDADLFYELAGADWLNTAGGHALEILKCWVRLRQSENDQARLKIPRYCHPDPFYHPTYCEFGDNSKPKVQYAWRDGKPPEKCEPGGEGDRERRVWLTLPDFNEKAAAWYCPLRWESKRLWDDLGGNAEKTEMVSRNDRVSRALNRLPIKNKDGKLIQYRPSYPFSKDSKGWNARLQAYRHELEKLAKQWDGGRNTWRDGGRMLGKVKWFLTFSPDLAQAERSFSDRLREFYKLNSKRDYMARHVYCRLHGLRLLSIDLGHRYAAACAVWEAISAEEMHAACEKACLEPPKADDLYLHIKSQDGKKTTIYRRIGADTIEEIAKNTGKPKNVPHPAPWARLDRQFLIKLQGEEKEARMATTDEIWRVHCLEKDLGRRIPLIDRLVKVGWGSDSKYPKQQQLIEELTKKGWAPINAPADNGDEEIILRRQSLCVDDIISSAVETARLALRRHSDRARIAFGLTTDYKPMPGDQKYWFTEQKGDSYDKKRERHEKHIDCLQDTLLLWHDKAYGKKWKDDDAEEIWVKHIEKIKGYSKPEEIEENLTASQRKKKRESNKERLKVVAEELVNNSSLRKKLRVQWAEKWRKDDGNKAKTEDEVDSNGKKTGRTNVAELASGWYARLRWLSNWILPSYEEKYKKGKSRKEVYNVGGLSLTRIATIKSLYQVQKAFFTRLTPDGRQMKDGKSATAGEGFGQSMLDALEHMRENRVKQLASRIAEAALGIGREHILPTKKYPKQCWCGQLHDKKKDPQRLRERDNEPRFAPCHAVVVENLTPYRPEEIRTRRENRQLMDWSAAKVKKYLAEACELNGLHLREVPAGYTSRQDSRTGAPGIRCVDVSVKEFLNSPFWKAEVKRAENNVVNNKDADARSRYLTELKKKFESCNFEDKMFASLRIPHKGGEIFVSAYSGKGLQADLNAAANIGLKALLDPDWQGSWWYVPADLDKDGWRIPKAKSCSGSACLKLWKVAAKDKSFSKDGSPLVLGNDEFVKKAEDECKEAKTAWDAAKKAVNAAKKDKSELNIKKANQQLEQAKEAHEAAKKKKSEAKKAAKAKPTINLWRDISAHPLIEGEWLEYSDYWKKYVPDKVVGILRR